MSEEVRRDVNKYGTIHYYNKANQLHRLDGPAVEVSDGYKAWCQNGQLHRLGGPAREWSDGSKEWWIEGKEYTEEEWMDARCPSIEEAATMFKEVGHE